MTKHNHWRPAPMAQNLLLEPSEGAIGTGIIPICGSARSGKTTLSLALISWAARRTSRPFAFVGLPDGYIEAYLSDRNADNRANRALGAVNAKVAAL